MRSALSTLAVATLLLGAPAWVDAQQQDLMVGLARAQTLRCEFTEGRATEWVGDRIQAKPASGKMEFVFDQVNLSSNRARMIGNGGGTDVVVSAGLTVLSFVEFVASGAVMTTSVFAEQNGRRDQLGRAAFRAVHSRHYAGGLPGAVSPMPQQWFGQCTPVS